MKFSKGELSRYALILAVALTVCLMSAATAFGAVGFGDPSPAVGAVVASPANIAIKAADADSELKAALCSIVVKDSGGNVVAGLAPSTVAGGVIKLDGAALAAGNYTATANAVDLKNKVYSKVWAFSVGGGAATDPLAFLEGFPQGSVASGNVAIGASFTGEEPASATVTVNGVAYTDPVIEEGSIYLPAGTVALGNGAVSVVVEAAGESISFGFSVAGAYDGVACFDCHADIMADHKFNSASGCDPCHGANSPYGGGYTAGPDSPHGDKSGSCISADCHGVIIAGDPAVLINTCAACHGTDPVTVHHSLALEDAFCDGCHGIGTPVGKTVCETCHFPQVEAIDVHHAVDDAATKCTTCHPSVVAQASPVLATAFGSTSPLVKKATMTHLKAGTGDPWLVNGNPATRKSECIDCHNIAATAVGDPLAGVTGYQPIFAGKNTWANFGSADFVEVTVGNAGADEAYLCVKCHGGPASAAGTVVNRFAEGRYETTGQTVTAGSGSTIPTTNFASTYQRGDIAKEFNPNNVSGHRVFADDDGVFRGEVKTEWYNVRTVPSNAVGLYGTNASVIIEPKLQLPIRSLKSWFKTDLDGKTWAYNTQMKCTDCHTNLASGAATGPHGANTGFGLDPRFPRDWKFAIPSGQNTTSTTNNNIICAKCHDLNDTNSSAAKTIDGVSVPASPSNGHRRSDHASYACVSCHTAIPHGSNRPRLLNDWNRDEQAYTKRQYGTAVSGASINILGAGPTRTNLTAAQLTSTSYAWASGSGATGNCTRGCNTHGSVSATQYVWE